MPLRKPSLCHLARWTAALILQFMAMAAPARATDLVQTIARIKPAVVGVGTLMKTRNPAFQLMGTGFAVADGLHIITNAHTYAKPLDSSLLEVAMVLVPAEGIPQQREAQIVALDKDHDLALLRISGKPLPVMTLGDSASVREGQMLAFTGYPLALVLGLHPATHRGMVSALVPVVLPGITARQLTEDIVRRIRNASYRVIQLDGTAYPGNSGSPLYDPETGRVYGIINKVFVQAGRESAINLPSGITYAIPSIHIDELLRREKIPGYPPP